MNYSGIIVGLISLAIIGLWHFIVIKGEYLLGKNMHPHFCNYRVYIHLRIHAYG